MQTIKTKAIVLRRTNYGESDRILQLLTPTGRYGAMARGVRREKSKLAGSIELFAVSEMVLIKGRGDLKIVTSARLGHFYQGIMNDYDRMQFAYTALEHVMKGSESLDTGEWYELLAGLFETLDQPTIPLALAKTWFYLHIASILGVALSTERDAQGQLLEQTSRYRYDNHERGFVRDEGGVITAGHIKVFRLAMTQPFVVLARISGLGSYLDVCQEVARRHAALE